MDPVAPLSEQQNHAHTRFSRVWLPPDVPAPPPPPVSLSALVEWIETLPDLVLQWTSDLPHSGCSYVWSVSTSCGTILLPSTLEAHPRECKCILAHEVGHHFTLRGRFGDPRDRLLASSRNECQACRVASGLLIPTGWRDEDIQDVCEECDVLPETVTAAVCALGGSPPTGGCGERRPRRPHR